MREVGMAKGRGGRTAFTSRPDEQGTGLRFSAQVPRERSDSDRLAGNEQVCASGTGNEKLLCRSCLVRLDDMRLMRWALG